MESFWAAVSLLGDPVIWSVAVAFLIIFYFSVKKKIIKIGSRQAHMPLLKKFLLLVIPVILVSLAGSELLKLVFQIPRPCIPCPAEGCSIYCPITFSFPSGHATVTTAIATALVLLIRKRRYLLIYAFPVLISISRVALGVHTAIDVIAGLFVGFVLTLVVWRYRKILYKWEDEIL